MTLYPARDYGCLVVVVGSCATHAWLLMRVVHQVDASNQVEILMRGEFDTSAMSFSTGKLKL
jgi:hypothetical protein